MKHIQIDYEHRERRRRMNPGAPTNTPDLSGPAGAIGIFMALVVCLVLAAALLWPKGAHGQTSEPWSIGMTPYGEVLGQPGGGLVPLSPQANDYGGYGAYPSGGRAFVPAEPYYAPPRSSQDPRDFHPDDGAARLR